MGRCLPRRLLVLPLAAAALAGCGGGSGASGGGADPAQVMPKSSAVYLEAAVRPDGDQQAQLKALLSRVLRTSDPGAKVRGLIDRKLAEEQPGVSFERDIEPWLGDRVGLTETDLAAHEPRSVAAVAVTDPKAAGAFVAREERREGARARSYQGTDYFVERDGTATGVVEDFVVIADTQAELREAVDTAAKGDGLSEVDRFGDARHELPDDRLGMLYLDPALVADAVAGNAGDPTAAGVVRSAVDGIGVVTAFGRASKDAATIESRTEVREGSTGAGLATLAAGGAAQLVKTLPGDAWAAYGVPDVGATLRTSLGAVGGGLGAALIAGQVQQQLGIDLDRDLLGWVGDVAVFVRGERPRALDGGVVLQATDADRAAAALPRLVGAARARGGIDFRPIRLAGSQQAWAAARPGRRLPLVLARAGHRVVLALGPRAAAAAADPTRPTLGDGDLYRRAKDALDGLDPAFVMDGAAVARMARRDAGRDGHLAELRPYLEQLDVLAAATTKDGDTLRQRFVVRVK